MSRSRFSLRGAASALVRTVAATLSGLGLAGAAGAGTLSDGQIIAIYIQVNGFDIETALLGRSQSRADAVRQLAAHVASDHLGVRQAAHALAGQCRVTPALPAQRNAAADDHGKAMVRLHALEGPAFDAAFLRHEAAFHRAAIAAVREQLLPAARCAELKTHLSQVLPAFEHHLARTEELERALPAK